jgi:hypothetical protein
VPNASRSRPELLPDRRNAALAGDPDPKRAYKSEVGFVAPRASDDGNILSRR